MNYLLYLAAIAGGVVAVVFFVLANGLDTEWGLASLAISWTLFLVSSYLPIIVATRQQQVPQ